MQAVHRDRHAFVCLAADGSVAHGAGVEARRDAARAFHLVERNRRAAGGIEVDEVAQTHGAPRAVQARAVRVEVCAAVGADGVLQQVDGLGVDEMILTAQRAPAGQAECGELIGRRRGEDGHRGVIARVELALELSDSQAAHTAHSPGEMAVDELRGEPHGLEDLGRVVALHRGDSHLGHDAHHARYGGAVVALDALLGGEHPSRPVREVARLGECGYLVVRAVGIDAACGVAHECGEVMGGQGVAAFQHDVGEGADAAPDEMVVDG